MATVTAVSHSFQHITSLLQEMVTSRVHKAETRIEASELLREGQEQSVLFIAKILHNYSYRLNLTSPVCCVNAKDSDVFASSVWITRGCCLEADWLN